MTSLYIHIPFCKKKCNYCDFASYAGKEELIDEYVDALIKEIQDSPHFNVGSLTRPHNELWGIETIYFGGGTPTLLEPEHFEKILSSVLCAPCSEISIEANPGTADKTKLKELRKLGINRLSIGAQSFNDRHLQILGRIHNSKDILKFYDDAGSAGFDNINLDLIFALPDQTLDDWKKDIEVALSLNPEHISTYNLQIEEGTPFFGMTTLQFPSEEAELAMYEYAIETLKGAGYGHYEISNFARPGFECKHNINYWKNGNYLGIGAGAHSHINGKRWSNPDSIEEYLGEMMDDGRRRIDDTCLPDFDELSRVAGTAGIGADRRETIFMGLRLLEGLPTEKFEGFEKEVDELIKDGLLMEENNHYKLTRQGLLLGNLVFEKFV